MTSLHTELSDALAHCGIGLDPAQAHGTLIGMCSADHDISLGRWIGVMLEDTATDQVGADALAELAKCGEVFTAAISSPDLEFEPVLPEDAASLEARLRALGEWCGSFLYGVAVGGVTELDALAEDSREFVQDLSEFTRLAARACAGNEAEEQYVELVEYVRVGVLNLYAELGYAEPAGDKPEDAAKTGEPGDSRPLLH